MRQSPFRLQLKAAATGPRASRGVGLIDALIALLLLSVGLLGMTRLQGRMVTAATDAQLRTSASLFADELLGTVLVDGGNAACYTLPRAGACASPAAEGRATEWSTRVGAGLPGTVTRTVAYDSATGRMTVTIGWTDRTAGEARTLQVDTDVRN